MNTGPFDLVESLSTSPEGGPAHQWIGGVVAALVPVGYGVANLIQGTAVMPSRSQAGRVLLTGLPATSLSIGFIAMGLFLHFHFFWGISAKLNPYCMIGKIIAIVLFIPTMGYAAYTALIR